MSFSYDDWISLPVLENNVNKLMSVYSVAGNRIIEVLAWNHFVNWYAAPDAETTVEDCRYMNFVFGVCCDKPFGNGYARDPRLVTTQLAEIYTRMPVTPAICDAFEKANKTAKIRPLHCQLAIEWCRIADAKESNQIVFPPPNLGPARAVEPNVYCFCRGPDIGSMIACDTCDEWYHFECVHLTSEQANAIDIYKCPACIANMLWEDE